MELSKEIRFLHDFCDCVEEEPDNLETLYSRVTAIIPGAMSYPDKCFCYMEINDIFFGNKPGEMKNSLGEDIFSSRRKIGVLFMGYQSEELVITQNERELIRYVCKRLGRISERYRSKRELDRALDALDEKNKSLEIKNVALAEVLNNLNESKSQYKREISSLIQSKIMPNLSKLEEQTGTNFYVELIKLTLTNLSHGDNNIFTQFTHLSQRELECCYLINMGLTSKEIADKLLISSKTVDKHRANIRRKMGLVGTSKNLFASLQFIDQN